MRPCDQIGGGWFKPSGPPVTTIETRALTSFDVDVAILPSSMCGKSQYVTRLVVQYTLRGPRSGASTQFLDNLRVDRKLVDIGPFPLFDVFTGERVAALGAPCDPYVIDDVDARK